jgi:hypothetical protein
MVVKLQTDLRIDNSEIARILSGGRRRGGLSHSILDRLDGAKDEARELIKPKAVYDILDRKDLPHRECFDEAQKVALAICTIGTELPDLAKKFMKGGRLVEGVLFDAIGSVAAEAVASEINIMINQRAKDLSLQVSERFSPGYCDWEISDQQLFFHKLNAKQIHVALTDAFIMVPVKSICFAVNMGDNVLDSRWQNRCMYCNKKDCSHRRS